MKFIEEVRQLSDGFVDDDITSLMEYIRQTAAYGGTEFNWVCIGSYTNYITVVDWFREQGFTVKEEDISEDEKKLRLRLELVISW